MVSSSVDANMICEREEKVRVSFSFLLVVAVVARFSLFGISE
jgi:hypothetical protein